MDSIKFHLNIEEDKEMIENNNNIKLDNGREVISKKGNVTIYRNNNSNPISIIKEVKVKTEEEQKILNEFYKVENPLLKREHKNILTLLSRKEINNTIFQFNYLYYPMNLIQFINNKPTFTEEELQMFTRQLLNGLNILTNKRKVSTFLLNPDNIFIDEKPNNRIIPILKYFNANLLITKNVLHENQEYLSPQLLSNPVVSSINTPDHFWALGILLFRLFFGYSPFNIENKDIPKDEYENYVKKGEYIIHSNRPVSLEFILLLQNLLQYNPERRIGWDDIQKNTFLSKSYNLFHMLQIEDGIRMTIDNNESVTYFLFNQLNGLNEQVSKSKDFLKISNIEKIQDSNFLSSKLEIDIVGLNSKNALLQTIIPLPEQNKSD